MSRTLASACRAAALALVSLCGAATAAAAEDASASADEDDIVTDRPDMAESSRTVGALRVQLETSGDIEWTDRGGVRTLSVRTPTKLRFGVVSWLELHMETDLLAWDRTTARGGAVSDEIGVADLAAGFKVHLFAGGGPIPSTGLLVSAGFPTGSAPFTEDVFVLAPTGAFDWDLSDDWSLGLNVGFTVPLDARERTPDVLRYALAVGRTWAPLLDRLRTYVEVFGETSLAGGATALALDGGFAWLATPWLQLDLTVRGGLRGDVADVGGGLGVSVKL
jgi:hypothetical protein